jgi:magnesium transporter
MFGIHPLVLEDILNTNQRPKIEFSEKQVFFVLKMLAWNEKDHLIEVEQISIILGENYVITYQENYDDIFDALRERLRKTKGQIRQLGADYLAYSLLDTIVDYYYIILEKIGGLIEENEEALLNDPRQEILRTIYILKRENLVLRKSVWPLREVVSRMERTDSVLIRKSTLPFVRDLQDHTTIVIETVESYMEMISNLIELFLSMGNNRLNEVMKMLTIISTIFIPLSFLAGIYGMNFNHMPELGWRWGYFALLGVMAAIAGVMVWFFRRKKWL